MQKYLLSGAVAASASLCLFSAFVPAKAQSTSSASAVPIHIASAQPTVLDASAPGRVSTDEDRGVRPLAGSVDAVVTQLRDKSGSIDDAELASERCLPSGDVQIAVEVSANPIETVFDVSLRDLAQLATSAGREEHMPLRAVFSSALIFAAEFDTSLSPARASQFCASAKSIRVRVAIGKRTIHAAREIQSEPCLLKAATAHAAAHARFQEERLHGARDDIAVNLKRRMSEFVAIASSSAEAERRLGSAISAQIDADLKVVDTTTPEERKAIDSPESLARMRRACPAEQADSAGNKT